MFRVEKAEVCSNTYANFKQNKVYRDAQKADNALFKEIKDALFELEELNSEPDDDGKNYPHLYYACIHYSRKRYRPTVVKTSMTRYGYLMFL
jgi:hypothetical protein